MRKLFTLLILALTFVGNAMAWEPVIKETHWFGMHEYYDSPVVGVTQNLSDTYLGHADFHDYTWSPFGSWEEDKNTTTYSLGHGNIGSYTVNTNTDAGLGPVPTDGTHLSSEFCVGIQVRWTDNANRSYAAYKQTSGRKLPAGRYRLSYDVLNNNNSTSGNTSDYFSKFYVQFGETTVTDNNTNWVTTRNVWLNHTIEFELTTNSNITVSLGYGNNQNWGQAYTPAVYVSHLKLEPIDDDNESISYIEWENQNSKDYIKSITVVRDWTGHDPLERPKTSFYSWIDHNLRFSVDNKSAWGLSIDNNDDHYAYDGLGLCNTSDGYQTFYIQDLKAGDKFNLEYYRYDSRLNSGVPSPILVSGSVNELNAGSTISGADRDGLTYYTMKSDGDVCINIPSKTIIRAVRIEHKNYKKATYDITEVQDGSAKGYKYTLTGAGVLEDKRGAVPYITMRFGSENDMTFVRNLGDGKFGTASIIDTSDDLNPTDKHLQYCMTYKGNNYDNPYSENEIRDRLEGKEWTTFVAEEDATHQVNPNSGWYDLNGDIYVYGDKFKTILPEYGTYYYFFPEVDGKLSISFYCEGANEGTPFWFKSKNGEVVDQMKGDLSTNGSYYYELKDVQVEKGGVYYLCSNPTVTRMQHPVVRLTSYTFIPTFRVDPLYSVVENGSQQAHDAATIKGVTIAKFTGIDGNVFKNDQKITINGDENAPMIKFLGNVTGAKVSLRQSGNDIKLDFDDITYKSGNNINKGGAIVVNLDCPAGRATYVLTVAYKAAKAEWGKDSEGKDLRVATNETGNVEVKKWDFFSKSLAVGTYGTDDGTRYDTNKNAWLAKSLLFREVHKADGLTADWEDTYVDLQNSKERIFKSVYDMEGDNADMIKETEGLLFLTESNLLGIYNENETSTSEFQDRYIGFMGESKYTIEEKPRTLIIPYLTEGDRIVIKMGSYGNADDDVTPENATLRIKGAKDAVGTPIPENADYVIGGSIPGEEDPSKPYGEYHFISAGGHFEMSAFDAKLLKIYSIEIYRNAANNNADILTENCVTADKQEVLFTDQDAEGATEDVTCTLRYRGYEEPSTFSGIDQVRGNLDASSMTFTSNTADNSVKTTLKRGDFGSFRAKMAVKTKDAGNTYVTDYAPGNMAVGYRETMEYPYTWDFTDLYSYVEQPIGFERQASNLDEEHKGWESYQDAWCLRNAPQNELGILFANGGQLYGANKMFDETAGLGFKRSTDVLEDIKKLNKGVGVTNTTLKLDNPEYSSDNTEFHKIVVPQVDEDAYIYVRATPVAHATVIAKYSTDGVSSSDFTKTLDVEGDKVYIMRNTTKQDVELWLNGVAIKKIGVSRDLKTVNVKGYASESRAYRIDHSLTNFFSGKKVKAYVVQGANYDNRTLTLFDITSDTAPVLAANQGCIIGTNDEKLEIIDGGFHLFAPDMHDTGNYLHETYGNMLKANVETEGLLLDMFDGEDDELTNYAMTYKYQKLKEDGTPFGDVIEGDEMFYRVSNKGIKLHKNSAYLQLPTSEVKPSPSRPAGCPMFSFIFTELDEGETVITGIEEAGVVFEDEEANAVWYNLNGQKLNGKPSARGIYIRNGKKVFVK